MVDWEVVDDSIEVVMTLKNFDISDWIGNEGERGIYLSLGLGSLVMNNSDALTCYMGFYGTDSDNNTFICTELTLGSATITRWWDPDGITSYMDNGITFNGNMADFSVKVVRPLQVSQSYGYYLEKGKVHDVNWAWGEHYPTDAMPLWPHSTSDRGSGTLDLQSSSAYLATVSFLALILSNLF